MDVHLLNTFPLCHINQGKEMVDMTMHPSVRQEPHQMEPPGCLSCLLHALEEDRVSLKVTILDGLINPGQVLIHNTPCPYIEVPDLRIPHLPFRQSYGFPVGIECCVRIFTQEGIINRSPPCPCGSGKKYKKFHGQLLLLDM